MGNRLKNHVRLDQIQQHKNLIGAHTKAFTKMIKNKMAQ